jgi:hypothetical protein
VRECRLRVRVRVRVHRRADVQYTLFGSVAPPEAMPRSCPQRARVSKSPYCAAASASRHHSAARGLHAKFRPLGAGT